MKKILLTGGTGFIGHHTVEGFLKTRDDIEITVLDRLSYAGDLKRLQHIGNFSNWHKAGRVKIVFHDIRAPLMEGVVKKIGSIDYIIHMAAETHVSKSIEDPTDFVNSNILGTFNILEFARQLHGRNELKLFVQISTDEVYGPAKDNEFHSEDSDLMRPSNPYAATKAAAENLAFSYYSSYGLPVIITRTMNNFGERQHPEKFVIKTLKALLQKKKVTIHGKPGNIGSRCWLHARNHADALDFLLTNGSVGEIYNIAGQRLTNLEMAEKIAAFSSLALDVEFVDFHHCRPGHDPHYALDDNKVKRLGWQSPLSLDESLKKTIEWTLNHREWL